MGIPKEIREPLQTCTKVQSLLSRLNGDAIRMSQLVQEGASVRGLAQSLLDELGAVERTLAKLAERTSEVGA